MRTLRRVLVLALVAGATLDCTGPPARESQPDNYLRANGFRVTGNESVLLRWQHRQMPLRVFLPAPPDGLFEDPQAIREVVRDSISKWEDLAAPGVPSFVFVDEAGEADIPVAWAEKPSGDWYIATVTPRIRPGKETLRARGTNSAWGAFSKHLRRSAMALAEWQPFGVGHLLITGRWRGGQPAPLDQVGSVVTHEFGHALGLLHSPKAGDIMYYALTPGITEPSPRDQATLRLLYESPIGRRVGSAQRVR